jgi:hypothetical protein
LLSIPTSPILSLAARRPKSSKGTAAPSLTISTRLRLFVVERDGENESGLTKGQAVSKAVGGLPRAARGLSLARRSIRSRPPSRSIALAVIVQMGGRKGNGHACRRAASHRDGHQKDEQILHRSIQRLRFHEGSERLVAQLAVRLGQGHVASGLSDVVELERIAIRRCPAKPAVRAVSRFRADHGGHRLESLC